MASRVKRRSSWNEVYANVARAKRLAERFGVHEVHPDAFLDPLPVQEANEWDDLLKKI